MMVGPGRFELPTSRLSGVRSNQLSYEPGRRTEGQTPPCPRREGIRGRRPKAAMNEPALF